MSPFYHDGIPNASGIYRITCTITGKIYIGSATNLRARRKSHFGYLQRNMHKNPKLQAAWNKYGEEFFTFEVLELVLPMSLTAREQYWFNKLKPFGKRGFNIALIAGSHLGMKRSQEVCNNISAAKTGRPNGNLGKKHSPEQIERWRQKMIDYKPTEETKRKQAEAQAGRKHSRESREKRSLALLGHSMDPKTRVAFSAFNEAHKQTLIFTAPDGTVHLVHGVSTFCKEHGLAQSSIMQVARGKQRQHRGWTAHFPD